MFTQGDLIYAKTRASLIESGGLVEVSEMAREAGFTVPVGVTRAVWNQYVVPDKSLRKWGQSEEGRLWDVLYMLHDTLQQSRSVTHYYGETITFSLYFLMPRKRSRPRHDLVALQAVMGEADPEGSPAITISLIGED